MARPTVYTMKLGDRVCQLVSDGASLRAIGEMPAMPSRRTMRGWQAKHPEFAAAYEAAVQFKVDGWADDMVDLADAVLGTENSAAVQAARLAIDTRKWLAAKLLPERFGDKLQAELTGKNGEALIPAPPEPWKVSLALLAILRGTEPQRGASEPPEPGTAARASPPAPSRLGTMDAEPVADLGEQRRQLRADRERGILSKYPRR
jgi:hypothetical protein